MGENLRYRIVLILAIGETVGGGNALIFGGFNREERLGGKEEIENDTSPLTFATEFEESITRVMRGKRFPGVQKLRVHVEKKKERANAVQGKRG